MSYLENYSILSPEAPNLLSVSTGAFGDNANPVDFSYGGSSYLPDGQSINPEDFAAFPKEMYDQGLVRPGRPVTVVNPATKKSVVVIPRHAKDDDGTGMDLAPHSILELGPASNGKYVLDLKPVKNYPVADYPITPSAIQSGAETSALPETRTMGDLGESPDAPQEEGGAPQDGGTSAGTGGAGAAPGTSAPGASTGAPMEGTLSKDGNSITYPSGITVYRDGHWTHPIAPGVVQSYEYGSLKPTKMVDPNYKSEVMDKSVEKMMIDRKLNPFNPDGTPLKASEAIKQINEFDHNNGILTPVQEKIAQQISQQLNTSRNPAISGYYKIKPKYDSIVENINGKTMDQRNGVDDAYLLNAAAGIENVDRAPTQNDYTEMLRAAGYRGNIQVTAERLWGLFNNDPKYYTERGTRILSDDMVKQIQQNADRVLAPRKQLLMNALAPIRERLKTHGIPENQVIPDGLVDSPSAPQAPQSSPAPAPAIQDLKPGGVIKDASGKLWKLKEGGNPRRREDYIRAE